MPEYDHRFAAQAIAQLTAEVSPTVEEGVRILIAVMCSMACSIDKSANAKALVLHDIVDWFNVHAESADKHFAKAQLSAKAPTN
jgi:hypothetical protein